MPGLECGDERTPCGQPVFSSHPGIELRSLGLAASTLTHSAILPDQRRPLRTGILRKTLLLLQADCIEQNDEKITHPHVARNRRWMRAQAECPVHSGNLQILIE